MNSKILRKHILNNTPIVYNIANGISSYMKHAFHSLLKDGQLIVGFLTARCIETLALHVQIHNTPN